jgi:hypothetical protein
MGFRNPILGGGGVLVYPSIHSDDYVPGVSGYTINKDGSVEFNNGTFRGTVTGGSFDGTNFIISPAGMFFYSGTPALGNLILSATNNVSVDSFGNVVRPNSFTAYGTAGANATLEQTSGVGRLRFPSGSASELFSPQIASSLGVSGTQFIGAAFEGAQLNVAGHEDWVFISLNSPNVGGTSFANGAIGYVNNAQVVGNVAHWDNTGFNIDQGPGNVQTDVTQRNATTSTVTQITPSYAIPANLMAPGNSWELELFLAGNQSVTTATTLEFFFQVNTNNTTITLPAGFMPANGAFRGRARLVVACKIAGAANTAAIFINGTVAITATSFVAANSTHWEVSSPNVQGPNASVDTTVSQLCAISAQWGTTGSLGGLYSRFQRLS